jgi:hypothetical protein
MGKLDFRKEQRKFYAPSAKEVSVVDVPAMSFLMADGEGDPDTSPAFAQAVEALFSLSFTIKFACKKGGRPDYAVMPLEGLWWADDPGAFVEGRKEEWKWTLMIRQPDFVTREMVQAAREELRGKKDLPAMGRVRLKKFTEGLAAQVLHVGPFDAEGPAIARLHDEIAARARKIRGKHHEIYLSDTRRLPPGKWKTIIRQPMS